MVEVARKLAAKQLPGSRDIPARAQMKQIVRSQLDDRLFGSPERRRHDIDLFVQRARNPAVQSMLGKYLASLSKKK